MFDGRARRARGLRASTIGKTLRAEGPWAEARVVSLLDALTAGLAAVHGAGLVHRDVKPANVMLRGGGSPVLIDIGAARQAVGGRSRSVTAVLTPGYAPIEQYGSCRGRCRRPIGAALLMRDQGDSETWRR